MHVNFCMCQISIHWFCTTYWGIPRASTWWWVMYKHVDSCDGYCCPNTEYIVHNARASIVRNVITDKQQECIFVVTLFRAVLWTGREELIRNKYLENWMWLVKFLCPLKKWFSISDGLDNFTVFSTRLRCENQFPYQTKMSLNRVSKLKRHIEENGSAAMLAAMRSAGVTPEVNVKYASTKCK